MSRKLERQLNELKDQIRRQRLLNASPVYCREGDEPDVDPERLVIIRREYVTPPPREEVELPATESAGDLFLAKKPTNFHRPENRRCVSSSDVN